MKICKSNIEIVLKSSQLVTIWDKKKKKTYYKKRKTRNPTTTTIKTIEKNKQLYMAFVKKFIEALYN